jgi:hypothetical protein
MKYTLKGEEFDINTFHVIADVQYPVGWFFSKENRDAIGIVEIEDNATPPPPPVPQVVTRRQARQALLLKGMLDKIEPAINALPNATQRGMALIEWQDSLNFERNRPLVIQIGQVLGLDAKGLDDLFVYAATL